MATEGFNFRKIRESNTSWRGPKPGEKINLSSLKNSAGKSLAETAQTRNLLLVTLDPECGVCNLSGDLINEVREQLQPTGIEYYPVSFARLDNPDKLNRFAASFGFQTKAFSWTKDGEKPPETLQNIVTPSHLLVDNTGKVIEVWAGASSEKADRERISRQIISDINIINDTLAALEQK